MVLPWRAATLWDVKAITRAAAEGTAGFKRGLGLLDFTLLVIGAVIGDGVYVVGSLGAQAMGPAQIVAWAAGGVLAVLIGIAFVQCATIDAEVGGSYAYTRMAYGPFLGFMAGWTLYIGEWMALSAFPTAFARYFESLTNIGDSFALAIKVTLIVSVTAINLAGVRQGARTNDFLTAAKLLPLALLVLLGLAFVLLFPSDAAGNLTPFAPEGYGGFSSAILPIFWVYAGFELAVMPAAEVADPHKTMPRGLIIGMFVTTTFYMLIALTTAVALPWQEVGASPHPLATVAGGLMQAFGGPVDAAVRLWSLGGVVSVAGVFVVFTLALARLSYALADDGFFPSAFSRLHPRTRTPYVGILFQGASSLLFSSLFGLGPLLSTAVLFLSICYVLTSLSAIRLSRRYPDKALHLPGLPFIFAGAVIASLFLTVQASLLQLAIAFAAVVAGAALYFARTHTPGSLKSRKVAL